MGKGIGEGFFIRSNLMLVSYEIGTTRFL
jgi:hypothetical protein